MAENIQYCFSRYEQKYLLTPRQYRALRAGMDRCMEADAYGRYTICSLYYDTPDFRLIQASLEKPVYKEKLRLRSYGVPADADPVFVELKKKFDGVVYKRRTVMAAAEAADYLSGLRRPPQENQISREIDWFLSAAALAPRVCISYDREALAGVEMPDLRVTFDTGLRWRDTQLDLRLGDGGAPLLSDDRILMEIKLPGAAPLWLSRLLSRCGAYPVSFSKYGTCYRRFLAPAAQAAARQEVCPCA